MPEPRTVRILKCVCHSAEWHGRRTSFAGMHDGAIGEVVGFTPDGSTLVYDRPGSPACRAGEVAELTEATT